MTPFVRDRFTWLAYFMLAYYSYIQATLGPLMPFLRSELDLSYTVAAFHLSAFALGMILAGTSADRAAARWGRGTVFWIGGLGMGAGGLLLTLGGQAALTIASAFLMGFSGSFLLVMIQASLADHHGRLRAIAITESNVAASISATIGPLVVGFGEATGLGWRISLVLGAIAWVVIRLIFQKTPIPAVKQLADPAQAKNKRPLPRRFWAYWLVDICAVSLEWCIVFWGADFLQHSVRIEPVAASTLMSVFFVAMVIGRFVGSRLTRTIESSQLLIYAIGVVCVGFPMFWLGQMALINIVGLFVTGLGIANLFPLTLSVATSIDPEQANTASARISLASGIAILVVPQVLASFADKVGIHNAFGVTAALLIAAAIIVFGVRRVPVMKPSPAEL